MFRIARMGLLAAQVSLAVAWGYAGEAVEAESCCDDSESCCTDSMSCCTPVASCCDALAAESCDPWVRQTLTGDWGGRRTCLQKSGVTFQGNQTHFGFGVDGGIIAPVPAPLGTGNTFKYTGRGDYSLLFDLEKFGGMPKGRLFVQAQHWWGEYGNVSLRSGTFTPTVFPAMLPTAPNDPGVPYMTDFLLTQPLSEKLIVFAGKKNVIGAADQDAFAGGNGTQQFVNQSLIANPAFLLGLPYTVRQTRHHGNLDG